MRSVTWAREKADRSDSETAADVLAAHLMGLGIGAALIMSLTILLAMGLRGIGST